MSITVSFSNANTKGASRHHQIFRFPRRLERLCGIAVAKLVEQKSRHAKSRILDMHVTACFVLSSSR